MDQYIGRLLDNRYEILEIIGTGGMAVVYKARCHRLNRLVAVKILKDEFSRDEEFRRRFHAEGQAVAMLSHPNIVQVFDVSTSETANFIVMELIDGISLKQYMEKKGVLNWKETLHFSMQIAKGLEHAHSRGIVHRDIKPHNIMVLKNGSVKVMDFGIARVMNKSNTLTKEALGSVHYISPEQAKGGHTDNRSDLYSLSVVMYEMMTGRPPYDGESAVAVAIQHINGGAAVPSSLNPNIPAGLEQIIMKGMALEIRDRYVSATEMLQDMEEFRKNPAIFFDYRTVVDDATRAIPMSSLPLTTAEKKVQAKTGERPVESSRVRQHTGMQQPNRQITGVTPLNTASRENDAIRRAQQRRLEERKKKETERSRIATTAVVICSTVAIVAIVIFLVALFNGALLNQEKDIVEVPYLEGRVYNEGFASKYKDFSIRLLPQQYHPTIAEGHIISQEPAGGEEVQRGSDIWITVSMGQEPPLIELVDFMGVDAAEAIELLKTQGFNPLKRKEPSYVLEAGLVTRTDPAAKSMLPAGQTVYVYVSTGPEIVERPVPNVLGLELSRAKALMEQQGFKNVRYEMVESQKPKDQVVYQSVENKEVDVDSEIIIHYSEGPKQETQPAETIPITTEATANQDVMREMTVTFAVPERDVEYRLDICTAGTKEVLASKMVTPGTGSIYVRLTGSGMVAYDLYVDGSYLETTNNIEFTEVE